MGGEISQQVTVDAPSRVNKLALCATSAGGSTEQAPSAPIEKKIMDDPQLPTWTLFGLSFPTPAGVKGAFDYAVRVSARYVCAHLPSDSFTESQTGTEGQRHARTVGLLRRWHLRRAADARHARVRYVGDLDVIDPPVNDRTIVGQLKQVREARVVQGRGPRLPLPGRQGSRTGCRRVPALRRRGARSASSAPTSALIATRCCWPSASSPSGPQRTATKARQSKPAVAVWRRRAASALRLASHVPSPLSRSRNLKDWPERYPPAGWNYDVWSATGSVGKQ